MESDGTDFQVLPDTLSKSKPGYPTNCGKDLSESTVNCLEKMSSNIPTYTQISGMWQLSSRYPLPVDCELVRIATAECHSYEAGSGWTVSNRQFSSMASFAPAMNVKNECLNPCHSRLYLPLGMNVMTSNTHEINHNVIQHMGTNSIVPLHDFGNCQHYPNLKNWIKSDPIYAHPHHPVSSIQLSPVNFYGPHYEHEMEFLPRPINENSNQSLLTNTSQKMMKESCLNDLIRFNHLKKPVAGCHFFNH